MLLGDAPTPSSSGIRHFERHPAFAEKLCFEPGGSSLHATAQRARGSSGRPITARSRQPTRARAF
eukprot:124273-Prymnesium_polylepis.1